MGTAYWYIGRQIDALAMAKKALEFRQRVLPTGHPDIAETRELVAEFQSFLVSQS